MKKKVLRICSIIFGIVILLLLLFTILLLTHTTFKIAYKYGNLHQQINFASCENLLSESDGYIESKENLFSKSYSISSGNYKIIYHPNRLFEYYAELETEFTNGDEKGMLNIYIGDSEYRIEVRVDHEMMYTAANLDLSYKDLSVGGLFYQCDNENDIILEEYKSQISEALDYFYNTSSENMKKIYDKL